MADPGTPMRTELVDIPLVPKGGRVVRVHPRATQNIKLLPILDLVARQGITNLECGTNNLGSEVIPEDSVNTNVFMSALKRMWTRAKKWNRGGPAVKFEWTHVIRFPSEIEIQEMPNTPLRQFNYLLFTFFNTILSTQGASAQAFIDAPAITEIDKSIEELDEFVTIELGTGKPTEDNSGVFETGEGMPNTTVIGIMSPNPLQGEATVHEPTSEPPPAIPPDTADV